MARILGLDLGHYSVKALLLDAAFRATTVKKFSEVRLQGETREAALAAALEHLSHDRGLQADAVAVAMPGHAAASQLISLPFNNEKQIEQTLPFEVEGQMLFDLDEIAYDHQPLAGGSANRSDLLVGAVKKEELRAVLEQLKAVGVDPRVVTLPAMAYATLLSTGLQSSEEVQAIVDVGHTRTSVTIGTALGGCEMARAYAGGGLELTKAIAADFKVNLEEAQTWKEKYGDVSERVRNGDDLAAYNAIRRGLQPLVRELRQTFRANHARFRHAVQRVHLCGGTARLPGLCELLTHELGIPVQPLVAPGELTGALAAEEAPVAAQAWALAQRAQLGAAGNKVARFNLRRGEFAFKSDFEFIKERLPRLAAFAAVLLALLGAQGYARIHSLHAREDQLKAKLGEMTRHVLGTPQTQFEVALSMLKEHNAPTGNVPSVSAVELLAELTNRIPADADAKLNDMEVTLNHVKLTGTVASFDAVDKISTSLKGYRCVAAINKGRVEKDKRDATRVAFALDIDVGCGQQAAPAAQGS